MTEMLSACARMIAPLEIAYVGQEGGFGHLGRAQALRQLRRAAPRRERRRRRCRRSSAAAPRSRSCRSRPRTTAPSPRTLNLLARSDAKICAEIRIRRAFHLISQSGEREQVKKIYASSSAIAACESYLRERFPNAIVIDCRNGMVAAQHAKDEADAAALATDLVAEQSGLAFVERSIEDLSDLETRYVAVGNDFPPRTGRDRTAVAIALHDAPGVLIECLRPFADRKLNIYRLETRPARGWDVALPDPGRGRRAHHRSRRARRDRRAAHLEPLREGARQLPDHRRD